MTTKSTVWEGNGSIFAKGLQGLHTSQLIYEEQKLNKKYQRETVRREDLTTVYRTGKLFNSAIRLWN